MPDRPGRGPKLLQSVRPPLRWELFRRPGEGRRTWGRGAAARRSAGLEMAGSPGSSRTPCSRRGRRPGEASRNQVRCWTVRAAARRTRSQPTRSVPEPLPLWATCTPSVSSSCCSRLWSALTGPFLVGAYETPRGVSLLLVWLIVNEISCRVPGYLAAAGAVHSSAVLVSLRGREDPVLRTAYSTA